MGKKYACFTHIFACTCIGDPFQTACLALALNCTFFKYNVGQNPLLLPFSA